MNIDLLQHDSNSDVSFFLDSMMASQYIPLINKPMRVCKTKASLIDHVFIKFNGNTNFQAGTIISSISDHYLNFVTLDLEKPSKPSNTNHFVRDSSKQNISTFKNVLNSQSWHDVFEACHNNNTELGYNIVNRES
jgi:hypothetical protein